VTMTASECRDVARLLGAYADGQLDAAKTLEVDDHLASCETCNERIALDRAMRASLKKTTQTSAPDDVKARMLAAMTAEANREAARADAADDEKNSPVEEAPRGRGMLRHWRTYPGRSTAFRAMLPLASAAALTLAWGFAGKQPVTRGVPDVMQGGFANDEVLRDIVDVHKRPIRPETKDPSAVRGFESDVGVPVRGVRFKQGNARFVGARIVNMHGAERGAMLYYEVPQGNGNVQRVSVFVYDPARVQIGSANLAPRAVGTAQVQVARQGGYSVAVRNHGGVAYAFTTDLDPDQSAQLVASAEPE
jgi:anti-sigma factor (TIGR02949 family)